MPVKMLDVYCRGYTLNNGTYQWILTEGLYAFLDQRITYTRAYNESMTMRDINWSVNKVITTDKLAILTMHDPFPFPKKKKMS